MPSAGLFKVPGRLGTSGATQPEPAGQAPRSIREAWVRITCCYSTGRTHTTMMRELDGGERRLIICCPFGELPIQSYLAVRHLLTEEEIVEVRKAFGWEIEPDRA
jgi:hypothetical protein